MLTIKELQTKLGVSSAQTIYNNKPSDLEFKKVNGRNMIDEELEKVITENVNKNRKKFGYTNVHNEDVKEETTTDNNNADDSASNNDDKLISRLESEVDNKNKQIDNLTRLLDQQQQLQLEGSKKIDKLEKNIADKDKQLYQLEYDKKDVKEDTQNVSSVPLTDYNEVTSENEKLKRELEEYKQMEDNKDRDNVNESDEAEYKEDTQSTNNTTTTNDNDEAEVRSNNESDNIDKVETKRGFFGRLFGK